MADSIPSLRRKLNEALAEIGRLKGQLADVPAPVVRTEYVYVDRPVPGPVREVEVIKEVKSPPEIRVEYVDREVRVPDPVYVTRTVTEYVDNPAHLRMIDELQERLAEWQTISQSDS